MPTPSIDIFDQIDFFYTGQMSKEGTAALIERVCEHSDKLSKGIAELEKEASKWPFRTAPNIDRQIEIEQSDLDKCNKFLSDTRDFGEQPESENLHDAQMNRLKDGMEGNCYVGNYDDNNA